MITVPFCSLMLTYSLLTVMVEARRRTRYGRDVTSWGWLVSRFGGPRCGVHGKSDSPTRRVGRRTGGAGRMHRWRGGATALAARVAGAGRGGARLARRVPAPWPYVIGLFLGAKLLLTLLGLLVLHAWDGIPGAPPPDEAMMWAQQREVSGHRWISFWFAWDALLYLRLSELPLTGGRGGTSASRCSTRSWPGRSARCSAATTRWPCC